MTRALLVLLLGLNGAPQPADYHNCTIIRTLPLLRSPQNRLDYRMGLPSNDRGNT